MSVLWTDLVRIYRCGFTQRHDLSLALDDTDIYGEDVWGRLLPDDDVVLVPNEWGIVGGSGKIALPVQYDVSPGYILWIKDTVVYDGARVEVAAALTDDVVAGATTLPVDTIVGFNDGAIVTVHSQGKRHRGKLRYATGSELVLYKEDQLREGFNTGDTISSGRYWRVTGRKNPGKWGHIQELSVVEIPFGAVSV
jgi:hypothetical protein